MGNQAGKHDQNKNNRNDPTKKKPIPPPPRVGRKKKNRGIDAAAKLPTGILFMTQSLPSLNVGFGS